MKSHLGNDSILIPYNQEYTSCHGNTDDISPTHESNNQSNFKFISLKFDKKLTWRSNHIICMNFFYVSMMIPLWWFTFLILTFICVFSPRTYSTALWKLWGATSARSWSMLPFWRTSEYCRLLVDIRLALSRRLPILPSAVNIHQMALCTRP